MPRPWMIRDLRLESKNNARRVVDREGRERDDEQGNNASSFPGVNLTGHKELVGGCLTLKLTLSYLIAEFEARLLRAKVMESLTVGNISRFNFQVPLNFGKCACV